MEFKSKSNIIHVSKIAKCNQKLLRIYRSFYYSPLVEHRLALNFRFISATNLARIMASGAKKTVLDYFKIMNVISPIHDFKSGKSHHTLGDIEWTQT